MELQDRYIAGLEGRLARAREVEATLAERYRAAFASGETDRRSLLDQISAATENVAVLSQHLEDAVWRRERALGVKLVQTW